MRPITEPWVSPDVCTFLEKSSEMLMLAPLSSLDFLRTSSYFTERGVEHDILYSVHPHTVQYLFLVLYRNRWWDNSSKILKIWCNTISIWTVYSHLLLSTTFLYYRKFIPFTTAGRKTDTIFEFFLVFLHTCHTVNNHLTALRFSEGVCPWTNLSLL